ncbi:hypothetical protein JTB14_026589 [Gonioctena quinquepunctata]|nr:hypothetical protein JTB14_026589 [Gonioctena quinquepunctata]
MDCELLITLVHERRSLWDQKSKQYHNRELNKKLWKEVATEMKLVGDVVRQKWRGLRDTFRKELSKLDQKRSGDGADDEPQSKWQYFKNMLFIKDQFAPRQTIDTIENATQYSTGAETDEDVTLGPMNNNDQSQLEIETDDQFQLDFATGDQSQAGIVTEINQQSFSNNKKRSATDQSKSNKTNPPQKKNC